MPWTVLRIISGLDAGSRVERGLTRLGFEFYNPKLQETWTINHRPVKRAVQLFPGYIFVYIIAQWKSVTSLTNVIDFIHNGDTGPGFVSSDVIDRLRALEEGGYAVLPAPPFPYSPGARIALVGLATAFTGRFALFEGMRGLDRCAVLLSILGKMVRYIVPLEEIAAA